TSGVRVLKTQHCHKYTNYLALCSCVQLILFSQCLSWCGLKVIQQIFVVVCEIYSWCFFLCQNGKSSEGIDRELEQNVAHFLAETSTKKKRLSAKDKTSSGMLKCSRCPASFRYKSTLSYHMKSDCGTKIIVDKELIKKGSSKEAAVCDICKKQLCSRTSLMVHMRRHTGERPFECAHCGKSFYQKAHLRDHVQSLHSPGQFLCRVCNTMYPDRAALDLHLRAHFPANTYPCQECGKVYTCKSGLTGHMGAVHSKGPKREFPCGACPAVLGRWRELLEHRRREHSGGATCQQCGLQLPSLSRWQAHLRKAHPPHGGPPPTCPICFKEFTTRYTLDLHLRSHTGERPYSCHICGRAFARKSTHDVHLTIHTGRKDYVCAHCGEAFNRKSKLDIHMADHFNMTVQCAVSILEFIQAVPKIYYTPLRCNIASASDSGDVREMTSLLSDLNLHIKQTSYLLKFWLWKISNQHLVTHCIGSLIKVQFFPPKNWGKNRVHLIHSMNYPSGNCSSGVDSNLVSVRGINKSQLIFTESPSRSIFRRME
ncbi:hypothetical protein AAG570_005040, partial [Ranatra chinensis]